MGGKNTRFAFIHFSYCTFFFLKAKRKLDLEDPLYLPEFRTPKGKCSLAARIPSPRSEWTNTHTQMQKDQQYDETIFC